MFLLFYLFYMNLIKKYGLIILHVFYVSFGFKKSLLKLAS